MTAYRPPARAWAMLTWTEAKLVARDTAGLVIPLGLPMLIMVMSGLGAEGAGTERFRGLPALDAFVVPMTMVMVVALIGLVNMPAVLATYRRTGVLRRLAVTPAHPLMVLAAQVLASLAQVLAGVLAALLAARLLFGASMPRGALTAVGVFCLVTATMYALGMLVAAVAPSANAAVALGLVGFFLTMALGGGFGPRDNLPDPLATLGEYLPYGAGVEALSAAWTGVPPDLAHIGALAGTAALAGAVAAKAFRWD
ncbi:ABC transporter permease [Actinomadura livida]|uniref:ABC transporter permease n=1 Tax=Actinomadura livida TaxID=79909 RepID=A0A7W7N245_9ACTN|nr:MULTISPECIES: ABC transporter permease [Actinomadura]MBB4778597.1 ABC-2 type transport system permease protein [Actinomadura catellatispora]GGU30141.1 transport permease protein [Actinomadura livida]